YLQDINPLVTLSAVGSETLHRGVRGDIRSASDASTGTMVFSTRYTGGGGQTVFTESTRQLRMDFHAPTTSVSLDVIGLPGSGNTDRGRITAYDSNGVQVGFATSALLVNGQHETLTITRAEGDIAYVIASAADNQTVRLDNLHFSVLLTAVTDQDGYFRIEGVPAGTFYTNLEISGNEVLTVQPPASGQFTVSSGQLVSDVTFGIDTRSVVINPAWANLQLSEGEQQSYQVRLSGPPSSAGVVTFAVVDSGVVQVQPSTLAFNTANWMSPQTVTVTAGDDNAATGTRTTGISVALNNFTERSAVFTVLDNDLPGFSVTPPVGELSEAASTLSFSVVLTSQPGSDVVLSVDSSDESEVRISGGVVRFTPNNWDVPRTIALQSVDDSVADGDQATTIIVRVVDAQSHDAFDAVPDQSFVVVTTDDDEPGMSVSENSVSVSESGTAASLTVRLTAAPVTPVTVRLVADDPGEVTVSPAILLFTASDWDAPRTINLTGVDDRVVDGTRQSIVRLVVDDEASDDAYDFVEDTLITVSTSDNDTAGVVVSETAVEVSEAGTNATVSVQLSAAPLTDVQFSVTPSDSREAAASPNVLTFTSANWDTPQQIRITGIDDDDFDGDQESSLVIRVSPGDTDAAFRLLPPQSVSILTRDNDQRAAGPAIVPPSVSDSRRPLLTWNSQTQFASYELWVSLRTAESSVRVAYSRQLTTGQWAPPTDLAPGRYRAWVRGIDSSGQESLWSESIDFRVTAAPTFLTASGSVDSQRPQLSWTTVPGAGAYEIVIRNRRTAEMITVSDVSSTQWQPPSELPFGDYRAWVRARVDGLFGDWSNRLEISVADTPTQVAVNSQVSVVRPVISWQPAAGAVRYELYAASANDHLASVIHRTDLTETEYMPEFPLPVGTFRVWIRSIDAHAEESRWSLPAVISVAASEQQSDLVQPVQPLTTKKAAIVRAAVVAEAPKRGN
ncbi:MAG: hypothetical protein KDA89_16220, partial [Planctomycetaceae bacterium]|nr:hypothetical protein [Planctomycetaceae bacterium]